MADKLSATQPIPRWQAWVMGARPRTLPAAISPVIVGIALAMADGKFSFWPALAALADALLIQIGTNLANDYFDHLRGIDTPDRKGPPRVAASGLIPLASLRAGIIVVFGLTALIGLYLVIRGGWPVLAIGLAAILAALAYSGGPFPFGSYGLGDLFVFIFFGLVAVGGTYYVQALQFYPLVLLVAVPLGALITDILVVNNYRDIETDARVGKRTLAVILGPAGARLEFIGLLILAYAVPVILWGMGRFSAGVLLPWLTIPKAVGLTRTLYATTDGPALNRALAGTAQLTLWFSILFSIGMLV
ncbi:MAG: 1,4-dihydroxy-2-naphthoate polyprenyltransferase [Anaerolineae bacterium]|nr:1,4-dihydroxy-2-naphthoate polyprenyltransferase [Anaerolineae bacterium]